MTYKFSSPSGSGYCGEKCQTATESECRCSCGGTNHGVALPQGNQSNKKNDFIKRINKLVKEGYTVQPPLLPNSVLITKSSKKLTKEEQELRLYQYYKKYGSPFLEEVGPELYTRFDIVTADPTRPYLVEEGDRYFSERDAIVYFETNDDDDDGYPDPEITKGLWPVKELDGCSGTSRALKLYGPGQRTIHLLSGLPHERFVSVNGIQQSQKGG